MKLTAILLLYFASFVVTANTVTETIQSSSYQSELNYRVSLPDNYNAKSKRAYPVIYVLHGQWDFSLVASITDTLAGEIPQFIVVEVIGKGQQLFPVTPSNERKAKKFRQYFTQELIADVKSKYATANYNILIGHSNAGRFALEQLLTGSQFFNDYFVLSPSLEDGYLTKLAEKTKKQNNYLYLTLANEGEHMQTPFETLIELLKPKLAFDHQQYKHYSHQSSKIVALVDAFKTRFADWQASYETKVAGIESLLAHHQQLSDTYGFDTKPNKDDLVKLIAYFATQENIEQVSKIRHYLINNYKDGAIALAEIKEYLNNNGYEKAAKHITL